MVRFVNDIFERTSIVVSTSPIINVSSGTVEFKLLLLPDKLMKHSVLEGKPRQLHEVHLMEIYLVLTKYSCSLNVFHPFLSKTIKVQYFHIL